MATCTDKNCERPARIAIVTERPKGVLRSTIYFDDRQAPKKAIPYCKTCGVELAAGLVRTLAHVDEEVTPDGNR